jgi:hypothetical protein
MREPDRKMKQKRTSHENKKEGRRKAGQKVEFRLKGGGDKGCVCEVGGGGGCLGRDIVSKTHSLKSNFDVLGIDAGFK